MVVWHGWTYNSSAAGIQCSKYIVISSDFALTILAMIVMLIVIRIRMARSIVLTIVTTIMMTIIS